MRRLTQTPASVMQGGPRAKATAVDVLSHPAPGRSPGSPLAMTLAAGLLAASMALAMQGVRPALAAGPPADVSATAAVRPTADGRATAAGHGLAVVAIPSSADAAWPLAQGIYAEGALRVPDLSENDARVLCGEAPPADAPPARHDLAEMVASLRGDDAPSRTLLGEVARRVASRALVVVRVDVGKPTARVFLPESQSFDAAVYSPDPGATLSWEGAVHSLARAYGTESLSGDPARPGAPRLATHEAPPSHRTSSRAFYESGWFWAALGGAALVGGGIFLATRDTGSTAIHLEVQVPH